MIGAAAARNFGAAFQSVDPEAGFVDELEPGEYATEPETEPEVTDVVFGGQIQQCHDDELMHKARKKLKKLFRVIDSDGNNYLDREEFREAIETGVSVGFDYGSEVENKIKISDSDFNLLFRTVNTTNDGVVDFKELWEFLKPRNVQKAATVSKHGDLYNLFKFKFLKALSHTTAEDCKNPNQRIASRFKLRYKIAVPSTELHEFENKLIGGVDGSGLYVGQDMHRSASDIPTGSILLTVGDKNIDNLKSQDIRNLIHYTEDHENCVCVFKNPMSLTANQRKNIPKEVWVVLSAEARGKMITEEERQRDIERDDGPFVKELYPPGHNRHTPDKRKRPFAYRLHRTMEDETYSSVSLVITVIVMTMILVSTFCYILETIPPLEDKVVLWETIESVVSVAFTLEYLLRILSCKNKWVYFWDGMNMVDFLAFVPFWIELVTKSEGSAQLRVIRVIRLARIIRLMKSPTFSTYLLILENTFRSSASSLGLLVTIIMLEVIVCGSLAYVTERGSPDTIGVCDEWETDTSVLNCTGPTKNLQIQSSNDDCWLECEDAKEEGCCEYDQRYMTCLMYHPSFDGEYTKVDILSEITPEIYSAMCVTEKVVVRWDNLVSPFFSIPAAMWWCVVTMTTVGYGDMFPITTEGRCIGILTMFSGLLVIALPVIIIGKDFENANTDQLRKNNRKQSSLNALARLKNDRKGTVEEFFKEVNDFFKTQFAKQQEANSSTYEYQAVSFTHDDESSFYEAGFSSKHQIEAILRCKRGFVYLPNYLHIPPPHASGYPSIPMYSSFSLWHTYGQLLRKSKANKQHMLVGSRY